MSIRETGKRMGTRLMVLLFGLALILPLNTYSADPAPAPTPAAKTTTETIVFIRHGEKNELVDHKKLGVTGAYGQLNCQGLNRALALPQQFINKFINTKKFNKPDYIFACNPDVMKDEDESGNKYYYFPITFFTNSSPAL